MDISDDLKNNPYYVFCKQLCVSLEDQTLQAVVTDEAKTREIVEENIGMQQPERVNDNVYIERMVQEMQKIAKELLKKRSQK